MMSSLSAIFRSTPFWIAVVMITTVGLLSTRSHAQDDDGAADLPAPLAEQAVEIEEAVGEVVPEGFWQGMTDRVENAFNAFNGVAFSILFYPIGANTFLDPGIPFIICVLVAGGVLITFFYGFVNIRLFRHSISVIRGRFDDPDHEGEVTSFKALTSALSATVGLGNIAGVAVAINMGGPGAIFWMWVTAVFGMSLKFSECTLAQLYRRIKPSGQVLGGPMVYLEEGIREFNHRLGPLGRVLAIMFATLTIFASFGGGNMFQSNQTYELFNDFVLGGQGTAFTAWMMGIMLAVPVGLVLLGGIRRIGEVTSRLVPTMCGFYMLVCFIIVLLHFREVPAAFAEIIRQAFNPEPIFAGGLIGVMIQGMRRAAFSNEAGIGSSAIAHSAAKTDEPVREGVVAMLEPFIDTILVCTMTALVIVITGAYLDPEVAGQGISITALALQELGVFMPYLLFVAVAIFAFSTIISWGYYGERATEYLFGEAGVGPFRLVYVCVVVLGPVASLGAVIDFADLMLLSMVFPNLVGQIFLVAKVKAMTNDYIRRLRSGEMKTFGN